MVFVLKRKRLSIVFLSLVMAICVMCGVIENSKTKDVYLGIEGRTIIIDAGHGEHI